MTGELAERIMEDLLKKCQEIRLSKGIAYGGNKDRLGNFKRCAELSNTTTEQVWYVYFIKHFDALSSYIRKEYKDSEPIEMRIADLINYLLLLHAIISEKEIIEEGI
jgi:hypothetical protein